MKSVVDGERFGRYSFIGLLALTPLYSYDTRINADQSGQGRQSYRNPRKQPAQFHR